MTRVQSQNDFPNLILHVPESMHLSDDQLFELCKANKNVRIERSALGELLIMPPTGGKTGNRNFNLIGKFSNWVELNNTGVGFDSSTGFILPNKALRSPDLAWVKLSRWENLSEEEQEKFIPLCPDFVMELSSPTDDLDDLKDKMQEYIDNGALLGWLIDPKNRQVYIYRPNSPVECLNNPTQISADPVLPGFIVELYNVWK